MRTVSLKNFKTYFDSIPSCTYLLLPEDQEWHDFTPFISARTTYKIMLINLKPAVICLKNNEDYLMIKRIKSVAIDERLLPIGVAFKITCGNLNNKSTDVSLCFFAQKNKS